MTVNQTGNQFIFPNRAPTAAEQANNDALQRFLNTQVVNRITNPEASIPVQGRQGTGIVTTESAPPTVPPMSIGIAWQPSIAGGQEIFANLNVPSGGYVDTSNHLSWDGTLTLPLMTFGAFAPVFVLQGFDFNPALQVSQNPQTGVQGLQIIVTDAANTNVMWAGWGNGHLLHAINPTNFYTGPSTPAPTVFGSTGTDLSVTAPGGGLTVTTAAGGTYGFIFIVDVKV
jgi:hypothetical protein